MTSRGVKKRANTSHFFGGAETERETASLREPYFCKKLKDFKLQSRRFHEFYAETEGAHNPRRLPTDDKHVLKNIVQNSFRYAERYKTDEEYKISKSEEAEYSAIADEILTVSKKVGGSENVNLEIVYLTVYVYGFEDIRILPLFKVYGNERDKFMFISRNRRTYDSLLAFVDDNDLPYCLVCAAREGSQKTYEIDNEINKYPLVYFTVNYSKNIDRKLAHLNVWSSLVGSQLWNLPLKLTWALSQSIGMEFKYHLYQIDRSKMITTSMKYKFLDFLQRHKDSIVLFGTMLNMAIVGVIWCLTSESILSGELLWNSLLMNGNTLSPQLAINFLKSSLPVSLQPSDPSLVTLILRVLLAVPSLLKEKPKNELEQGKGEIKRNDMIVDDGDHSLIHYLKTHEKEHIKRLSLDEEYLKNNIEPVVRKCVDDAEQKHFQITYIMELDNWELNVSVAPISVIVENLLENSYQNARVYAVKDDIYEISSDEALYRILPLKIDERDVELQLICFKRK